MRLRDSSTACFILLLVLVDLLAGIAGVQVHWEVLLGGALAYGIKEHGRHRSLKP